MKRHNISYLFPLWKENTTKLVNQFVELGFKTLVVCTDSSKLGADFIGKTITKEWVAALPEHVDPCGENGEFHTFVYDGPIFKAPVPFEIKEIVTRTYPSTSKDETEQKWEFLFVDLV